MSSSSWKEFAERETASESSASAIPGSSGPESGYPAPGGLELAVPLTVRMVGGLAGLLAAGSLVLALVLLAVMLVVQLQGVQTDALGETSGPGWSRTGIQLGAAVLAEVLVLAARKIPARAAQVALAAVAIAVALTALWWVWWR